MNNTDERDFNKILETIQSLETKIDTNFVNLIEQIIEIHKMSKQDLINRQQEELEKTKQIHITKRSKYYSLKINGQEKIY